MYLKNHKYATNIQIYFVLVLIKMILRSCMIFGRTINTIR